MDCKNCGDDETLVEASGYCFSCAEEVACMLADAGATDAQIARSAWGRGK